MKIITNMNITNRILF